MAVPPSIQSFLLNLFFLLLFQEKEDWLLTTAQPTSSPKMQDHLFLAVLDIPEFTQRHSNTVLGPVLF